MCECLEYDDGSMHLCEVDADIYREFTKSREAGPVSDLPGRKVTERGFITFCEITDSYGQKVRVGESSSAEGPHVWIFLNDVKTADWEKRSHGAPHLNIEQATIVRDALTAFIAHATETWGAFTDADAGDGEA